jgi:GT2 family glycosyltransferase
MAQPARVAPHPTRADWDVILRDLPDPPPLVSVIVPTRDRADLLGACARGVLSRTDYPALELIVIDHDSREPATLALFASLRADSRVRIVPYSGPFNFSEMNNRAAAMARGELLCFLNNDIEVIRPGWLREMAAHAVLPGNGAVGAKLLYGDRRVQHCGMLVGVGAGADHLHRFAAEEDPGRDGRLALATNISAVTGACLVLRKALFEEVGGFEAEHLKVAFNDVDLCLKIRAAGYRNVSTPRALLFHHESQSRGSDEAPENRIRYEMESRWFTAKWREAMTCDPFSNPNFSGEGLNFELAFPPRRQKTWMSFLPPEFPGGA